MFNKHKLANLGWLPYFQQQLSLEEWESTIPARVVEQHRNRIEVVTEEGATDIAISTNMPPIVVGDWLLLSTDGQFSRRLERKSIFRRKAPGSAVEEQLIAANVDTAFVVCSLNDDFNLSRVERFLSVTREAGCDAVLVLSKADLCQDSEPLICSARALDPLLCVEAINCVDSNSTDALLPWLSPGATVVLLGSSGSGKSTLTNTLLGKEHQLTGAIREDDSKGRHTTTRRSLIKLPGGALILDTPGMRELQLSACETGVMATFPEMEELALKCRFNDCRHADEPGCAIQEAIARGDIDQRRFTNYQKLLREQALNSASLAERRAEARNRGRYYKRIHREAEKLRRG